MALTRWCQKLGDCSALIRPVSVAFLYPGFPRLPPYLPVSLQVTAHACTPRHTHTHAGKVYMFLNQTLGIHPLLLKMQTQVGDRHETRLTHERAEWQLQRWSGGLRRDVRECVNPHSLAFPLWIGVRLNFSRGGRQGAIGHSVNVSGSEQPELRQPCAVACHSHTPLLYPSFSFLFFFFLLFLPGCCLFSPLLRHPLSSHPPSPTLLLLSFTFALPLPAGK